MSQIDERRGSRKGVFLLPSILTTGGLFAGFYSIILCVRGDFWSAAVAILVANCFDVLDGRIARLTKTETRFGFQYDSLSDVIAFGVAPGLLVYRWALEQWGTAGWLAASTYVACSALRLARFNSRSGSEEKRSFIGLPTPAAADVIASLVLIYYFFGSEGETHKQFALLLTTYLLAGLMVSNFSYLGIKGTGLRGPQPFWTLVAVAIVLTLIIAFPQPMLFGGFTLYAASGPLRSLYRLTRRKNRKGPSSASSGRDEPPDEPRVIRGGRR